jgi:GDP-4-dehydro-6-deoxy-D-mannose reductase
MVGPGLPEKYAPSMILKRMREAIESGSDVFPIVNGNAVRDFIDVRDVARAWALIVTKGTPGIPYSLGNGQGVTIQTIAEIFADLLGTSMRIHDVRSGDSNGRSDCTRSIADPTRLLLDTGFSPLISLKESLQDMLHQPSLPLRTPNHHL